jgi:hypothetical protein
MRFLFALVIICFLSGGTSHAATFRTPPLSEYNFATSATVNIVHAPNTVIKDLLYDSDYQVGTVSGSVTVGSGGPFSYFASSGPVVVNSVTGEYQATGAGDGVVDVRTPLLSKKHTISDMTFTGTPTVYRTGTLGRAISDFLDSRIASVTGENCSATCTTGGACATCPAIELYSTYDHTGSGTYVRSASSWTMDTDVSSMPVAIYYNAAWTGIFSGIMVSPVHLLQGHVLLPPGTILRFVGTDGVVYARTVGAGRMGVDGLYISIITEALPANVSYAEVFTVDWYATYAPGWTTIRLPVMVTHQWHNASVMDIFGIVTTVWMAKSVITPRSLLGQSVVGGDSSTPVVAFVPVDSSVHTVALTAFWTGGGGGGAGVLYSHHISAINAAMATLQGCTQGAPGSYSLSQLDLSGFTCDWAGCPGQ